MLPPTTRSPPACCWNPTERMPPVTWFDTTTKSDGDAPGASSARCDARNARAARSAAAAFATAPDPA